MCFDNIISKDSIVLKNMMVLGATLMLSLVLSACGGGGGGGSDDGGTSSSSTASTASASCDGMTLDENTCYLGYIGLDSDGKACCDSWIAEQN